MQLQIQNRVEITLRSLPRGEQKQLRRAFAELSALDRALLRESPKLSPYAPGFSIPMKLFVYQVNGKLNLLLSLADDACIVEDVVYQERLNQLVARKGSHEEPAAARTRSQAVSR